MGSQDLRTDRCQQHRSFFQAQRMTLGMTHVIGTRSSIDSKEFIHQLDDASRILILGIQFHGIDKLPSCVRQTPTYCSASHR